jgi:hypothetical protein
MPTKFLRSAKNRATATIRVAIGLILCASCLFPKEPDLGSTPAQRWSIDLNSSASVRDVGSIDANTDVRLVYLGQNRLIAVFLFPIRVDDKFSSIRDRETWRALLLSVDVSDGKVLHSFAKAPVQIGCSWEY